MAAAEIFSLALFTVVSTITPGGATTLATSSGAHFGYRRSLPLVGGIALGLGVMAAAAAMGLGSLILALPSLQHAMKLVGTVYLLWLALKMARSGPPSIRSKSAKPIGFPGAIWLVWHNPKGWAMTLGAAASFASLASDPLLLGCMLGFSFATAAMMSLSLWCYAGLLLAQLLKTDRQWRILNLLLALLLAASVFPMWFE